MPQKTIIPLTAHHRWQGFTFSTFLLVYNKWFNETAVFAADDDGQYVTPRYIVMVKGNRPDYCLALAADTFGLLI